MTKKRITKIDPKETLSRYLDHQSNESKGKKRRSSAKISASLSNLHRERKSALVKRLGLIIGISAVFIIIFGYYISPLANVKSVKVEGAEDLPVEQVVKAAGIKSGDKVLDYLLHLSKVDQRLPSKYTEIKNVNISVKHFNQLVLHVNEYKTIGYIKKENGYCKILTHGKLGTQELAWNKISQDKPVFIGYNHEVSLKKNLQLFNSLPSDFQSQIKLLSGNTRRKSQVIFLMKDGNVVIGNLSTLKSKIKYYNEIKNKVGKNSLIDLEVGAYSRPLTPNEKRAYGLT